MTKNIEKLIEENRWQDISTAPMDGTQVLIYVPRSLYNNIITARYRDGLWRVNKGGSRFSAPTHWMHLPKPPIQQDDHLANVCDTLCKGVIEATERLDDCGQDGTAAHFILVTALAKAEKMAGEGSDYGLQTVF